MEQNTEKLEEVAHSNGHCVDEGHCSHNGHAPSKTDENHGNLLPAVASNFELQRLGTVILELSDRWRLKELFAETKETTHRTWVSTMADLREISQDARAFAQRSKAQITQKVITSANAVTREEHDQLLSRLESLESEVARLKIALQKAANKSAKKHSEN